MALFVLIKAAQGFAGRRTYCTPQPETRGERRAEQKGLFLNGQWLKGKKYPIDADTQDHCGQHQDEYQLIGVKFFHIPTNLQLGTRITQPPN
jgi:hypothetical protein